jgi:hypothetical protein
MRTTLAARSSSLSTLERRIFSCPNRGVGKSIKRESFSSGQTHQLGTTGTRLAHLRTAQSGSLSTSPSAGGSRPYILDGNRKTKADGSPDAAVPYWSSIRARARELLPDAVPGEDYAITEIVHCKSEHEKGVREAAKTCYDFHMENVFARSPERRSRAQTPSFPKLRKK